MASKIHKIAVLTSGGDGPGFNPCIRAVVRMAINYGWEVLGVKWGYVGLINGEAIPLNRRSVGGIIGRGGTFLGTARSPEFKTKKGQIEAARNLNEWGVDGVVVIGGDGSMRGAIALGELGLPAIGLPGTIDNDLYGTDMCIGVDTALNTALEAIDRIKDTASSHQRAFLVEVMGRNSGYLALMTGIAGGAEMTCIPEVEFELEDVVREVKDAYVRGKTHCIISVAEGARYNANAIARYLNENKEETGFSVRVTILGHIQRGGSPTAFDRLLATRLGAAAVRALNEGQSGVMMGLVGSVAKAIPLEEVVSRTKDLDPRMCELARILAR
jgi:6-phosphofructokinase 1